jgi:C1A family cysteine protease
MTDDVELITSPKKTMGWLPDQPDNRDYVYEQRMRMMSTAQLPTTVSLRTNCSPVRNQRDIGSCTGFAVAAGVEYLRRTDEDKFKTIYSPMFLYYEARKAINLIDQDSGCYIRDAVKTINKIGVPPESVCKYYEPEMNFRRKPPARAYREAARWRIDEYYRCTSLLQILDALAKGYPVVGGFTCYSNMWGSNTWNTGLVPMPTSTSYSMGGHAVLFMGYDRNAGTLNFKNSWGTQWGDNGYGRLPFGYVEQGMSGDFWALTRESAATNPNRV